MSETSSGVVWNLVITAGALSKKGGGVMMSSILIVFRSVVWRSAGVVNYCSSVGLINLYRMSSLGLLVVSGSVICSFPQVLYLCIIVKL